MSAPLESKHLSLNEAVTLLAFGERRTPSQELALHRVEQNRLAALIDGCLAEGASDAKYRRFPRRLPYLPISALIELLEDNQKHGPPSAAALLAHAQRLADQAAGNLKLYDAGLQKVFCWATEGKLTMPGRTGEHPASPVVIIDPSYFLGAVTISHTWNDLGPTVASEEGPKPGSILHTGPGLLPIFYGVKIPQKMFIKLSRRCVTSKVAGKDKFKDIESWYCRDCATLNPPPTREEDEAALKSNYPEAKKVRATVRHLRAKHLKTRRGRRKLANK